jgi:hypothetical protein
MWELKQFKYIEEEVDESVLFSRTGGGMKERKSRKRGKISQRMVHGLPDFFVSDPA